MRTQLTVNLLRVLFVTLCAAVGSSVTAEAIDNPIRGLLIGLVFGLLLVLSDRLREIDLAIHDSADEGDTTVDARLVRLAQVLGARILTNDQPLCQVARLQQVPTVNLADLSCALRPVVVTGDELDLNLVKEGRDPHQGVGYLADGTMIVVNLALQTAGGRMIFVELKENARVRGPLEAKATP